MQRLPRHVGRCWVNMPDQNISMSLNTAIILSGVLFQAITIMSKSKLRTTPLCLYLLLFQVRKAHRKFRESRTITKDVSDHQEPSLISLIYKS
jgi:hypothetical protein